jgi:hypothetical protein
MAALVSSDRINRQAISNIPTEPSNSAGKSHLQATGAALNNSAQERGGSMEAAAMAAL